MENGKAKMKSEGLFRNVGVMLFVAFPYLYIAYMSTLDRSTCAAVLDTVTRTSRQMLEQQEQPKQQQQQLPQQLIDGSFGAAVASLQELKSNFSEGIAMLSSFQIQSSPPQSCPPQVPSPGTGSGVGCRMALGLAGQKQTDFVSFEEVLDKSTSDKRHHKFGHMYAEYFDPIKYNKIAFLEIGLRGGDSIALWKSFFPNAKIYGIDKGQIFQGFRQHVGEGNVNIFVGDQANVTFLRAVREVIQREVGELDFIIDDGGHTMKQQQTSLIELLPAVKPSGYYFIEDLETSYYDKCTYGCYNECCGGGRPGKKGTTVDVLKSMIDKLNEDFIPGPNVQRKWGVHKHKVIKGDDLIASVQCWRNMCVLRKKKKDSYF